MSNYFICKNEYEAKAMHYITQERYYRFTNNEGNEVYTFKKCDKIFEAYKIIMDARNKFEREGAN